MTTDRGLVAARALPRVIGLALSAGILFISGSGYVAAVAVTDKIRHTQVFAQLTDRPPERGGTNILLVGSDNREGISGKKRDQLHVGRGDFGQHTDTIMIAHIADDGSIGFVSIPRDSYVQIPEYTTSEGRTVPSSHQKINAAYEIGGASLVTETVEVNTGVRIDHYAEISFLGFVSMVEAVGGVPITTNQDIHDEKAGLDLPAGTTTLNGAQALAYVRARQFDPSADLGRMKRQQQFMGALFDKATSPAVVANPVRLLALADALAGSITVDENMGRSDVWGLIASTRAGSFREISFETVPISGDSMKAGVGSVVEWNESEADKLFAVLNSGDPLGGTSLEPEPTVEVAPASIRVQVYNGSGQPGLATEAGRDLQQQGFVIAGSAQNAQTKDATDTVIQYDPRYDVSLKTLEAALPGAKAEAVPNLGRTFKIVVGSSYAGVTPVKVAE